MTIGFDVIFLVIVAGSTIGCFFIGEEKSQRLMIGVLAGSFIATQLAQPLSQLVGNRVAINNQSTMAVLLMVLCIAPCVLAKKVRNPIWPKSKVKAMIAGFISSLVAVSYVIASIEPASRDKLITDHNLAALAYSIRIYALVALVLWLLASYLLVGKAKK